jgi:hypothetical protein
MATFEDIFSSSRNRPIAYILEEEEEEEEFAKKIHET